MPFGGIAAGGEASDRAAALVDVEVVGGEIDGEAVDVIFRVRFADFFAGGVELEQSLVGEDLVEVVGAVDGDADRGGGAADRDGGVGSAVGANSSMLCFCGVIDEEVARGVGGDAGDRAEAVELALGAPAFDQGAFGGELGDEVVGGVGDVDVAGGWTGGTVDGEEGRAFEAAGSRRVRRGPAVIPRDSAVQTLLAGRERSATWFY